MVIMGLVCVDLWSHIVGCGYVRLFRKSGNGFGRKMLSQLD